MQPLRDGLILEIARAGGLQFKQRADRSPLKCPFHDDRHASAVLIASTNCFYCSVCTPEGGWSAKRFAEALGVDWNPYSREFIQHHGALVSVCHVRDSRQIAGVRPQA